MEGKDLLGQAGVLLKQPMPAHSYMHTTSQEEQFSRRVLMPFLLQQEAKIINKYT